MNMKLFQLTKSYAIVCEWKKTRIAFKHEATILFNGSEVYKTKVCYQNRTWESYEFQSVLHKAISGYFTENGNVYIKIVDGIGRQYIDKELAPFKALAALGEVLGTSQKEKNAFKQKALKAIPGISFPDDFDKLSDDEKTKRLDGAIAQL